MPQIRGDIAWEEETENYGAFNALSRTLDTILVEPLAATGKYGLGSDPGIWLFESVDTEPRNPRHFETIEGTSTGIDRT